MSFLEKLRSARRSFFFVFYVLAFLIEASLVMLFVRHEMRRRGVLIRLVSRYCRVGMFLLNCKVNVIGMPRGDQHYLLVGNHLGFLDILVLASVHPVLFVTSVEMKNTPGLGILCEMGGCIFVERRSRSNIMGEMGQIRDVLEAGYSVALYPEGTSGDGSKVLPFKKTMMMSAAGTGVPLKVMVTNYRKINDHPMTDAYRDYVCWYGDMSFVPSIWKLFSVESIEVELSFHEEVIVHSAEERREIAEKIQHLVETHYDPIPFPPGKQPSTVAVQPSPGHERKES